MSIKYTKVIVCFLLLLSLTLASGCISPPEKGSVENESETEFVPAPVLDDNDAEMLRYREYREKIPLAFSEVLPAPEKDFEYSVSDDGQSVVINGYSGSERIVVIPETVDGKNVLAIAESAFKNSNLRAVYVPDSIKNIGKGAFAGCSELTTLRLPIIGDGAEYENAGYIFGAITYESNAVSVPASLNTIIYGKNVTYIPDNAFSGFKSIEALSFEGTLDGIGKFAFYENSSLIYAGISTLDGEVGNYAFAECKNLVSMSFGTEVERIGLGTFLNCNSLKSLTLPFVGEKKDENQYLGYIFGAENVEWNSYFVPKALKEITLLDSCSEIENLAFSNCGQICSIVLPDTIKKIGIRAFYKCSSLREITIPNAVEKIGDDAFFMCLSLGKVTFEKDADVSLGKQMFFMCTSLEKISLPDSTAIISPSMFYGCKSLKTVNGKGISSIGKDAFYGCMALEEVATVDADRIESGNTDYINAMNKNK